MKIERLRASSRPTQPPSWTSIHGNVCSISLGHGSRLQLYAISITSLRPGETVVKTTQCRCEPSSGRNCHKSCLAWACDFKVLWCRRLGGLESLRGLGFDWFVGLILELSKVSGWFHNLIFFWEKIIHGFTK